MTLGEYVVAHAERGSCVCGKCCDTSPESRQPGGHTVDMTFFKVRNNGGTKEEFLALVQAEFPQWLDGEEHNYIEMGAEIGDQGVAIMTIALGHLLSVWRALTPAMLMPDIPDDMKMMMAQQGMVCLVAEKEKP